MSSLSYFMELFNYDSHISFSSGKIRNLEFVRILRRFIFKGSCIDNSEEEDVSKVSEEVEGGTGGRARDKEVRVEEHEALEVICLSLSAYLPQLILKLSFAKRKF